MVFFEFSMTEHVSENFKIHVYVEPVGNMYKYRLCFDDGKNVSEIVGNTHTPYGSILDLRNHMLATMDTLADSIEDVKMAAHQIENYQASSSEDDEYNEDEENGELNGF